MVAYTFLPAFDNANGGLSHRKIIEIKKFCCDGHMTSHFSLLRATP